NFALGDVTLLSLQRGIGKHGILRRDPAAREILLLHPARDVVLDRHSTDNARVAPLNERRAGGVRSDVILKTDWAQLLWQAAGGAGGGGGGRLRPGPKFSASD